MESEFEDSYGLRRRDEKMTRYTCTSIDVRVEVRVGAKDGLLQSPKLIVCDYVIMTMNSTVPFVSR